jgi:SNF2 family DNA or RNA helicase
MPLADVDVDHGEVVIRENDFNWTEKDLIGQVPGMNWSSRRKCWHGPLSWGTVTVLRGIFKERLRISDQLRDWAVDARRSWIDPAVNLRDLIEVPENGSHPRSEEYERLYPPQRAGVRYLHTVPDGVLICDEMGTGKSPTSLVALEQLGPEAWPALIICPNSVKGHWAKEAARWAPSMTPYVVNGSATKRRDIMTEAGGDPTALLIINFEAVRLHSRLAPYGSVRLRRHG